MFEGDHLGLVPIMAVLVVLRDAECCCFLNFLAVLVGGSPLAYPMSLIFAERQGSAQQEYDQSSLTSHGGFHNDCHSLTEVLRWGNAAIYKPGTPPRIHCLWPVAVPKLERPVTRHLGQAPEIRREV